MLAAQPGTYSRIPLNAVERLCTPSRVLPAALGVAVRLDLIHVDADHGLAQSAGGLGDLFRIVEERGGLHDGGGTLCPCPARRSPTKSSDGPRVLSIAPDPDWWLILRRGQEPR